RRATSGHRAAPVSGQVPTLQRPRSVGTRHGVGFTAGMDSLRQDLAYGLRRLRQAPFFRLIAGATLAPGVGANGAIFSVVDAVLLRPLPFGDPARLVRVSQVWEGRPVVYSPQNFLDVQSSARAFESLAAYASGGTHLTGHGRPVRLEGAETSASFFDVLQVRPEQGRGFVAGENEPDRRHVAVISHALWRDR